jgi:hypothetical protein
MSSHLNLLQFLKSDLRQRLRKYRSDPWAVHPDGHVVQAIRIERMIDTAELIPSGYLAKLQPSFDDPTPHALLNAARGAFDVCKDQCPDHSDGYLAIVAFKLKEQASV